MVKIERSPRLTIEKVIMPEASIQELQQQVEVLTEQLELCRSENRALRISESKYRHLFENSPLGGYVTDRTGRFININEAGVRQLGFDTAEEVIGKTSINEFYPGGMGWKAFMDDLEREGSIGGFETKIRKKNGEILDVHITAAVRTGLVGKAEGYEGFIMDITSRKKAEEQLRFSEQKHSTVLKNSLAAIFMFQDGGIFSYVNPRLVEIMGYKDAQEIIGTPFWEYVHPEDRQMVKDRGLRREKQQVQPQHYAFRVLKKDGTQLWIDMQSTHTEFLGKPVVVGNFIDITGIREAENEVRQLSRKLINVQEVERKKLAADLHDEFGRRLTNIQFYLEYLQKSLPAQQTESVRICNTVMDQIQNLAESVRKTTSRLRPDILDYLGLVPTLKSHLNDFQEKLPGVDMQFQEFGMNKRMGANTELVLYRVFQESLTNIIKHASARHVTITLTCSHPDVILMIHDDGTGFRQAENGLPAEMDHYAIGLMSMRERVAHLGGRIEISSIVNKGTKIRVVLPVEEVD